MHRSTSALCVAVVAVTTTFVLSVPRADEPKGPDRPERFLMFLKVGDQIAWTGGTEPNGYRVTIYSEDQFQEIVKVRESQKAELQSLNEKLKGNFSIRSGDEKSEIPEVKQRFKEIERRSMLSAATSSRSRYGKVTYVGSDYIAVLPLNEEHESFVPAWSIVSIGKAKSRIK